MAPASGYHEPPCGPDMIRIICAAAGAENRAAAMAKAHSRNTRMKVMIPSLGSVSRYRDTAGGF
jgi:hypothetical protein